MNRSLPTLAALALAACQSTPPGSPAAARPEFRPIAGDDAVYVWFAGREALLADPKDRDLDRTLAAAPARALELPADLEDDSFPADAIALALEALASPWELAASVQTEMTEDAPPFRAQWSVRAPNAAAAGDRAARLTKLLTSVGVPSLGANAAMHGLVQIPAGPMNVFHGVAKDGEADTWIVALGEPRLERRELGTLDLPNDAQPFLAFKIDLRQIERGLELADPEAAHGFASAVESQGDSIQGGCGRVGARIAGGVRVQGWREAQQRAGLLASRPLSRDEVALVPGDATWAVLGRTNPRGWLAMARTLVQQNAGEMGLTEEQDPFAMLHAATGFDVDADLVATLGETWGMYRADSTGGAGWLSTVAFFEVRNAEGLARTLDDLESRVGELATQFAHGRVTVRAEVRNGAQIRVLSFPGLPVPLELSWAQAHGFVWFAATPQALDAALAHAGNRGDGLLGSPAFRAVAGGGLDDVWALSFTDVERYAREGWTQVALLGSALSNAFAAPIATDRTPVGIVPGPNVLLRDVRAAVSLSRVDDNGDLVTTSSTDGSALVNAASTLGWLGDAPWFLGALVAAGNASKEHEAAIELPEPDGATEMDEDAEPMDEPSEDAQPPGEPEPRAGDPK